MFFWKKNKDKIDPKAYVDALSLIAKIQKYCKTKILKLPASSDKFPVMETLTTGTTNIAPLLAMLLVLSRVKGITVGYMKDSKKGLILATKADWEEGETLLQEMFSKSKKVAEVEVPVAPKKTHKKKVEVVPVVPKKTRKKKVEVAPVAPKKTRKKKVEVVPVAPKKTRKKKVVPVAQKTFLELQALIEKETQVVKSKAVRKGDVWELLIDVAE
jgi:hypothetical protein